LILPPDEVKPPGNLRAFLLDNRATPRERKRRRKDGSIVYTEATDSILHLEKGQMAVISVVRDISRRKRTEESLFLSEDRYRRLFEDAVVGIFRTTLDGKLANVNPACARMLGFDSPEEAMEQLDDVAVGCYADPSRRSE